MIDIFFSFTVSSDLSNRFVNIQKENFGAHAIQLEFVS